MKEEDINITPEVTPEAQPNVAPVTPAPQPSVTPENTLDQARIQMEQQMMSEPLTPPSEPIMPDAPELPVQPAATPVSTPVAPQAAPQVDPSFGTNVVPPVQPVPEPTKKKSKLPVILIVLVLLAGGGFACWKFVLPMLNKETKGEETTTTTAVATKEITGTKYDVLKKADAGSYYSEYFVLSNDNKLYAQVGENWGIGIEDPDGIYEGVGLVKIAENVKSVHLVESGNGGFIKSFYITTNGDLYYIPNIASEFDKDDGYPTDIDNTGYTNVKDIYSLGTGDAFHYIAINNDNEIIFPLSDGYIYYDKKNKIGKNRLPDGRLVEISEGVDSVITFYITEEGKEKIEFESSYDPGEIQEIDLLIFNYQDIINTFTN